MSNIAIVMCYDKRRRDCAEISVPTARALAKQKGWFLVVEEYQEAHYFPHIRKLQLIKALLPLYHGIVYADVDVLFRTPCHDFAPAVRNSLSISCDENGFCTGFMVLDSSRRVRSFVDAWLLLCDPEKDNAEHEQATFKLFHREHSTVAAMTATIDTEWVSNPECEKPGMIAHHFWHTDPKLIEHMKNFDWSKPLPPKW